MQRQHCWHNWQEIGCKRAINSIKVVGNNINALKYYRKVKFCSRSNVPLCMAVMQLLSRNLSHPCLIRPSIKAWCIKYCHKQLWYRWRFWKEVSWDWSELIGTEDSVCMCVCVCVCVCLCKDIISINASLYCTYTICRLVIVLNKPADKLLMLLFVIALKYYEDTL